mgnify:FL=1
MKKIKLIFLVILICLIFSSISIYAAIKINSKDIGFTPKNSEWQVDNVEEALNELYSNKIKGNRNFVEDGLFANLDYKNTQNFIYGINAQITDEGFLFSGSNSILIKRFQSNTMSYEVYFKPSDYNGEIISSREAGGCAIIIRPSGLLNGDCYVNGDYRDIASDEILEINKWYHAVLTVGGNGMKLYLNGTLRSSNNYTSFKENTQNTITMIGCNSVRSECESPYFKGNIKMARIYSKELSSEEVKQNYDDVLNYYK